MAADIVVFDPRTVGDRNDFDHPSVAPAGIVRVYVNGKLALHDGNPTGARAGKPLFKLHEAVK